MKISVISVGKIKEKYLKEGIAEYSKRLSRYCKLIHIEVQDEKAPEILSDKEEEQIKEKEGRKILNRIKESQYVFALDLSGEHLTSEDLAKELEELPIYGKGDLVFIIGGSLGLSKEVLKRSNVKLSFSKMTFPHQLMKMILLEQIYRGFRIIKGEPYHK